MAKRRVLFLCTGNSCRSQMAEGIVNHFLGEQWEALSAGTEPAGEVHPLAIQAMAEMGVDIRGHHSKSTAQFRDLPLDLVVTVCDDAAENCPLWLGSGTVRHISFPDPARARGTEEERMEQFRRVRDDIHRRMLDELSAPSGAETAASGTTR